MNSLRHAKSWIEKRLSLSEEEFVTQIATPLKETTQISSLRDLPITKQSSKEVRFSAELNETYEYQSGLRQNHIPAKLDAIVYSASNVNALSEQDCQQNLASLSTLTPSASQDSLTSSEADNLPMKGRPNCTDRYIKFSIGQSVSSPIVLTKRAIGLVAQTVSNLADQFGLTKSPAVDQIVKLRSSYPQALVYVERFITDMVESDPDSFDLFKVITRMTVYGPWMMSNQSMLPVYSQAADLGNLAKCFVYHDVKRDSATVLQEMSFGFAASSWLLPYELGVAQCIQDVVRADVLSQYSFIGCQTGVVPAIILALQLDGETLMQEFTEAAVEQSRSYFKGAASQLANILKPILEKSIPDDISSLGNRLHIICAEFPSGKERRISQFKDKQDLIKIALASCSLPIIGSHRLSIDDEVTLVSNQFTNKRSSPVIDKLTMTVQPFHGVANICPESQLYAPGLLWKCSKEQAVYFSMFEDGYRNCHAFLKDSGKACILSSKLFKSATFCREAQTIAPKLDEVEHVSIMAQVSKALGFFETTGLYL